MNAHGIAAHVCLPPSVEAAGASTCLGASGEVSTRAFEDRYNHDEASCVIPLGTQRNQYMLYQKRVTATCGRPVRENAAVKLLPDPGQSDILRSIHLKSTVLPLWVSRHIGGRLGVLLLVSSWCASQRKVRRFQPLQKTSCPHWPIRAKHHLQQRPAQPGKGADCSADLLFVISSVGNIRPFIENTKKRNPRTNYVNKPGHHNPTNAFTKVGGKLRLPIYSKHPVINSAQRVTYHIYHKCQFWVITNMTTKS